MSTTDRKRIAAAFWWHSLADTFDKVCREFITRALAAEKAEKGHECGHQFEITVRSALHVSGPSEHTDADWWSDNDRPVTVRAHNLRDALLAAASLPLTDWFEDEPDPLTAPRPAPTEARQSAGGGEQP